MIKCTRWSELSEAMIFQAQLSEALGAPSEFRLLNGADPIVVGLGDDNGESLKFFEDVMAESPAGQTPLCEQIRAVVASIQSIATELRAGNQKVAVIIASDGESSDGNVADALRPLTNVSTRCLNQSEALKNIIYLIYIIILDASFGNFATMHRRISSRRLLEQYR